MPPAPHGLLHLGPDLPHPPLNGLGIALGGPVHRDLHTEVHLMQDPGDLRVAEPYVEAPGDQQRDPGQRPALVLHPAVRGRPLLQRRGEPCPPRGLHPRRPPAGPLISAASNRTRSRPARSRAVRPPPSGYLISHTWNRTDHLSPPSTSLSCASRGPVTRRGCGSAVGDHAVGRPPELPGDPGHATTRVSTGPSAGGGTVRTAGAVTHAVQPSAAASVEPSPAESGAAYAGLR